MAPCRPHAISPARAGQAVGNILKSSARRALPQLGQAVGDYFVPGTGGQAGRQVGKWLGSKFETGLQLEGLSAEDRELETARAFVPLRDLDRAAGRGHSHECSRGHAASRQPSPRPSSTSRGL